MAESFIVEKLTYWLNLARYGPQGAVKIHPGPEPGTYIVTIEDERRPSCIP